MRKQRFLVLTLCLHFGLLIAPRSLAGAVWYVKGKNGDDTNSCKSWHQACKTIGHAVSLASSGDTVLVAPALYNENLNVTIDLQIVGASPRNTVVDGGAITSVVTVAQGARVSLAGLTLRNGEAGYENFACGGGINNQGTALVFNVNIIRNAVGDYIQDDNAFGGGICNYGYLSLDHSVVRENEASYSYWGYGAGVYNRGTVSISDSTISENVDGLADLYGTGIFNDGVMTVNRSAINRNQGAFDTSGVYNNYEAVAIINNTTISFNGAGYDGPAVSNYGTMNISNGTIVGNLSDFTIGGLFDYQGNVTLQNTIVADNNQSNCSGTIVSAGYNLSSDSSCNFDGSGDLNNIEPKLGPLRNNGGPTRTMAELPGSPTIDAGNPEGCTDGQGHRLRTDQRGFPRPGVFDRKHRCDIGAFERQKD